MQSHEHERRPTPRTITPLSTPATLGGMGLLRFPYHQDDLRNLVRTALDEDEAFNDLTTIATVVSDRHARGQLVSRAEGVLCGVPLAVEAFRQLDPKVTIRVDLEDGARLRKGSNILYLSGHARALLAAERVALNFMQRLSGIATLTARYVDAVKGTKAKILDTRKTTPGWRLLEKYAVRAGGGTNHRLNLSAAVLIKDNHLAAVDGDVALAVRRARDLAPAGTKIEVECDSVEQVKAAVDANADIVMFDNMRPDEMAKCVELVAGRAITEASGGVNLQSVRHVAQAGVDWISVGALTHSAPALDLALDFE
ncbi:MAG: carboxylating nicotinate-nucleotide diphosphorylase [Gemmatimonadetes bacterium]|nr:MAG: carboxylating nicotinate-nucleotide diphosphorylase [Gemmatimonadota bacterium]